MTAERPTFDSATPDLEVMRHALFQRLRDEPDWKSLHDGNNVEKPFEPYLRFVPRENADRVFGGCVLQLPANRFAASTVQGDRSWIGGKQDCKHRNVIGRQCEDCRAEHLPPLSFHSLRHSCASILLAQGVPVRDVAEILGHSDVRLTLGTYAHVIEATRDRAAGVMDRMLQIG